MRYAFLVAYDGSSYFGFVRQPNVPTVEGQLLKTFRELKLFRNIDGARYKVAARTDRGVSALSQVVALDLDEEPDISLLNSELPEDIAILSSIPVQRTFDPRKEVLAKHYRYVCDVPAGFNFEIVKETIRLLEGSHDFKCFCKREPGGNTKNSIMYTAVRRDDILIFDFIAKFFLRQQVRRMVQGLLELGRGLVGVDWFSQAVNGACPRSFKPAHTDGLFLAGIRYRRLVFKPNPMAIHKIKRHLEVKDDIRAHEMLKFLKAGFKY